MKNPSYLGKVRSLVNKDLFFVPKMNTTTATVTSKTGDTTLTASDMFKVFNNTGAAGTITLTLPAASVCKEAVIRVALTAAQIVRLDPNGSEKIYLHGDGVAGKYLNIAAVIGNYAEVYCDGTNWDVTCYSGVLTKEP